MNIAQINSFLVLCETLSFTQAAKSLFVTQSYLSRQIAALEREIGFPLFERTRRSVALTPQGEAFRDTLANIPKMVETAISRAASRVDVVRGNLSIGVLDGVPIGHDIPPKMKLLRDNYPEIMIHEERYGFREMREGLSSGKLDLAITMAFEVMTEEYDYQVIRPQTLVIAINHINPLAQKEDLSLRDLKGERFVMLSPKESASGYQHIIDLCKAHGFEPEVITVVRSMESLLLNVEVGLCVAVVYGLNRLSIHPDIRFIPLQSLDYMKNQTDLVLAWRKDNPNPALPTVVQALG